MLVQFQSLVPSCQAKIRGKRGCISRLKIRDGGKDSTRVTESMDAPPGCHSTFRVEAGEGGVAGEYLSAP